MGERHFLQKDFPNQPIDDVGARFTSPFALHTDSYDWMVMRNGL